MTMNLVDKIHSGLNHHLERVFCVVFIGMITGCGSVSLTQTEAEESALKSTRSLSSFANPSTQQACFDREK